MKYQPTAAVWEITMGCNMRCKHCGSRCEEALSDELTTNEALTLCDQIGDLGLKWITLSGGEPLTRKDLPLLIKRLRKNHVIPNIITNGWLLTEECLEKLIAAGVGTIALSIDGLEETHDYMRRKGSYEKDMQALELMAHKGIETAVITTLTEKNMRELNKMYEVFQNKGVKQWQLQIGLPMGNLKEQQALLLKPERIEEILDFIYDKLEVPGMQVYPADCIGYYTEKDSLIRGKIAGSKEGSCWQGCGAGKSGFGILQNGDILGCTSIRDQQFIEGNIRERSLKSIWEDKESFSWSRQMKRSKLKGKCKACYYGEVCLGGCSNTRLTMNRDIYSENNYCAYGLRIEKCKTLIQQKTDAMELLKTVYALAKAEDFQLAKIIIERLETLNESSEDFKALAGFIYYSNGDYKKSLLYNESLLMEDPGDTYALKGKGLCLCKMGRIEEGLSALQQAAKLTSAEDMEPYEDWIGILLSLGKKKEALEVFNQAEAKQEGFIATHKATYQLAVL